jgi:N-acylneuraminate cytidylyltransferase
MPNCPLRTALDVRDSYQQFEETGADSQISVVRYGWQNPWWAMRRSKEHRLESIFPEAIASRSQDLPELFCPTGAIWWARAEVLSRARTFYIENATGWAIPWQRGIDIDTPDDWAMAEVLKKQIQFKQ